jgi:hypothetical protein
MVALNCSQCANYASHTVSLFGADSACFVASKVPLGIANVHENLVELFAPLIMASPASWQANLHIP